MSTVPAFTPLPGGFITVQTLDGTFVVESWWLNPDPSNSDRPCSQPVSHWIAADADEAVALIAEFADDLDRLTRP